MKYRLLMLFTGLVSCVMVQGQVLSCIDNTDFKATTGKRQGRNTNYVATGGRVTDSHTIISSQGFDPNTGTNIPLSTNDVRLGYWDPWCYLRTEAQAITYRFTVNATTPILLLDFAVVYNRQNDLYIFSKRFVHFFHPLLRQSHILII